MKIILTEQQYKRLVENESGESTFDFELNMGDFDCDDYEGRCEIFLSIWEDNAQVDDYVQYAIVVDFSVDNRNHFVTEFWPISVQMIHPEKIDDISTDIANMYMSDENIRNKVDKLIDDNIAADLGKEDDDYDDSEDLNENKNEEILYDYEIEIIDLNKISEDEEPGWEGSGEGECKIFLKIQEETAKEDEYTEYQIDFVFIFLSHWKSGSEKVYNVEGLMAKSIVMEYPEKADVGIEIADMYLDDNNIYTKLSELIANRMGRRDTIRKKHSY